jgi:hypothetical protein
MSILGKFCKAYPLHQLRQFSGWSEEVQNARQVRKEVDGQTIRVVRELTDDDYLYVQENLTVTDGIFLDEHVIFSNVTPEWAEFCRNVLGFEVPSDADEDSSEGGNAGGDSGNAG